MTGVSAPTRIALKNIMVATDFSACADGALTHAQRLARRYGGTLYVLNVLPHTPFVESAEPDPEQMLATAQMKMDAVAASLQGIKHTELIREGEVPEVISQLVRDHHIDLIVLGTEGRTGLGKFLLGSVAEDVFRHAECPVLTLGPHAVRWTGEEGPKHILYATDFGASSLLGLASALSLAEEHHALLTMAHIAPEPGVVLPEPEPGAMPVLNPYEVVTTYENQLRNLIPNDIQMWHEPECIVQFGPVAETVLRMAKQDVDLIVLGVKRPALLEKHLAGGIVYRIVCEAPCPVLTVGARGHH